MCLSATAWVCGALYSSKLCSETIVGFFPKLVEKQRDYLITYLFAYLLSYVLTYLLTYLLNYLLTYFLTSLLPCFLVSLLTCLLTYFLTSLLTYLLTYLLNYFLASVLTYLLRWCCCLCYGVRYRCGRVCGGRQLFPALWEQSRWVQVLVSAWLPARPQRPRHMPCFRSDLCFIIPSSTAGHGSQCGPLGPSAISNRILKKT